jgi:hypothetical protein
MFDLSTLLLEVLKVMWAHKQLKFINMDEVPSIKLSARQCFIHFEGKFGELCHLTHHTN